MLGTTKMGHQLQSLPLLTLFLIHDHSQLYYRVYLHIYGLILSNVYGVKWIWRLAWFSVAHHTCCSAETTIQSAIFPSCRVSLGVLIFSWVPDFSALHQTSLEIQCKPSFEVCSSPSKSVVHRKQFELRMETYWWFPRKINQTGELKLPLWRFQSWEKWKI